MNLKQWGAVRAEQQNSVGALSVVLQELCAARTTRLVELSQDKSEISDSILEQRNTINMQC